MRRFAFLLCSPGPRVALILLLASSVAATAGAATARGRAHARHRASAAGRPVHSPRASAPIFLPGLVVAIDPETGALVPPTPEQRAALAQGAPGLALTPAERTGLMRSSECLTEQRLADGGVRVNLQGRFREFATISVASGRPSFACVHDSTALSRILEARAPAPTPAFEEK